MAHCILGDSYTYQCYFTEVTNVPVREANMGPVAGNRWEFSVLNLQFSVNLLYLKQTLPGEIQQHKAVHPHQKMVH